MADEFLARGVDGEAELGRVVGDVHEGDVRGERLGGCGGGRRGAAGGGVTIAVGAAGHEVGQAAA